MKHIIGLLVIGLLMISCDPAIGYEYYLDNQSDSTLIVQFRGNGFNNTNDSIRQVQPKTVIKIFDTETWGKDPQDEKDEFLRVFDTIAITTINRISIRKDIYKRENWTYDNDISHNGVIKTGTNIYKLKLTNDDI